MVRNLQILVVFLIRMEQLINIITEDCCWQFHSMRFSRAIGEFTSVTMKINKLELLRCNVLLNCLF